FQKAVARLQRGLGGRWSERKTAFRYRQWIAIFVELGLRRSVLSTRRGLAAEGRRSIMTILAILIVPPATHPAVALSVVRPLIAVATTTAGTATTTVSSASAAAAVRAGTKPLFSHLHTRKRLRF